MPALTLSEPNMDVFTTAPKLGTVSSPDVAAEDEDAAAAALLDGSVFAADVFGAASVLAGEVAVRAGSGFGGCGGGALGAAGALFTGIGLDCCSGWGGGAGAGAGEVVGDGGTGGFAFAASAGCAAFFASVGCAFG